MKTYFSFISFLLLTLITFCCRSSPVSDTELKPKEKRESKETQLAKQFEKDSIYLSSFKSFKVKKISGKHKYGGSTKIEYESLLDVLKSSEKYWKKQLLSEDEVKEKLKYDKRKNRGGKIILKIDRSSIEAANNDNFKVVVRTMEGEEILRQQLKRKIPERPIVDRMWWNLEIIRLPSLLEFPFKVYVIDALNDDPFEFEVTGVK